MSWNRTAALCMALTGLVLAGCNETTTVVVPDTAPPLAPQDVKAYIKDGFLCVRWSPNTETDLAGYNVYQVAPFSRLNGTILTSTQFAGNGRVDRTTTYRVTAVDNTGNESAPSRFARITDAPTGTTESPAGDPGSAEEIQ